MDKEFEEALTFGQRVADKVAQFGGSWTFIFIFGGVLLVWVAINSIPLILSKPFDLFPAFFSIWFSRCSLPFRLL